MNPRDRRRKAVAPPPMDELEGDELVRNAADKAQVRKAKKTAKDREEDEREEMRYCLQFPQFRQILWRLMAHCRTFESNFHPDPYQHAFNAGVRDVGNYIMVQLMDADPDAFIRMVEENRKEMKL